MSLEHEGNPLWLNKKEGEELDEDGNPKKKKELLYGNDTLNDVNEKKEDYQKKMLNE